MLGHGEDVEGAQRAQLPPGIEQTPERRGRRSPGRTRRRPACAAFRACDSQRAHDGGAHPLAGRVEHDHLGAPDPRGDQGRGRCRAAVRGSGPAPAPLCRASAHARASRSTARTDPPGPTAAARGTENRPGARVEVDDMGAPAVAHQVEDGGEQRLRRPDVDLPEDAGRDAIGAPGHGGVHRSGRAAHAAAHHEAGARRRAAEEQRGPGVRP